MTRTAPSFGYYFRNRAVKAGCIVIAASTLLLVALVAIWWPVETHKHELEASLRRERAAILEARKRRDIAQAYSQAKIGVDVLHQKLTYAATQAQQVADIAQLARRNGVTTLSQAYEENSRAHNQLILFTELTVQASYRSVSSFIAGLPELPSWTEVQEVTLERGKDRNIVKGRIRLATYRGAAAKSESK